MDGVQIPNHLTCQSFWEECEQQDLNPFKEYTDHVRSKIVEKFTQQLPRELKAVTESNSIVTAKECQQH